MPPQKKKPTSLAHNKDKGKPRRGCWTCKERRVSCDRTTPHCSNCSRSNRMCQGYGVRLSWPRDDDPKRAIKATVAFKGASTSQRHYNYREMRVMDMSSRDMELYQYLRQDNNMMGHHPLHLAYTPPLIPSILGDPNRKGPELLGYFASVAYMSLANLEPDQASLGSLLVRMAASGGSGTNLPATALLSAILAVSSLHKDGFQAQALRYKIAAIKALAESMRVGTLSPLEAAQHAAAGMLLATFECQYKSESSGQWVLYVCGSKGMIETGNIEDRQDLAPLLDWVQYQHVVSRFVLRHWRHWSTQSIITNTNNTVTPNERAYLGSKAKPLTLPYPNPCTNTILGPLSEMCEILLDPSDPRSTESEYRSRLRVLEWAIMGKPMSPPPTPDGLTTPKTSTMHELASLANSVYLIRSSADPTTHSERLEHILDRAFSLLADIDKCERMLPIILLGCEARDDEEKVITLDLIARSRTKSNAGSMGCVEVGVRLMWNQRDLELEDIARHSYQQTFTAVISSACTFPVFV